VAAHASARLTRSRRAGLLHGIYAILNDDLRMLDLAEAVLDAGIKIVQYRAKGGINSGRLAALRARTRARDALLIVNDDWRAAATFDCDGVHLGPGDAGFERTAVLRADLRERLIGVSCGTIEEVRAANAGDVDYLGVGSIYVTTSKNDAGTPIGSDGLYSLAAATTLPVAAIGGVTATTIAEVRRCGAAMAAVISAISAAAEPRVAARALVGAWNGCAGARIDA
jgi:thiamine-phosphate diphosphorylase